MAGQEGQLERPGDGEGEEGEEGKDRLRDPTYDPRWDPKEPLAPGVLGGWIPELQGECRPGCENLARDVTVNTNYGRINGFYVYLYDGPRVPLYG